jgi:FSR family fosmidomycin resistance protein-like MFS transporter
MLPHQMSWQQTSLLILLYNLLAFGHQPIAGVVTDRWQRPRVAVWVGLGCLVLAVLLSQPQPQVAIVLAGIGSAAFHVGGGALATLATPNQTLGAGLFTAPGVVGLAIGGALGIANYPAQGMLILLLLGLSGVLLPCKLPTVHDSAEISHHKASQLSAKNPNPKSPIQNPKSIDRDWLLLVLLSAIALNSVVWTGFQFFLLGKTSVLIAMAIAAAIGKLGGSILAEMWGWRRGSISALVVAMPLLILGESHLVALLAGVALLQSTVPVTLTATVRLMPQQPATASSLALGLAIVISGVLVMGGVTVALGMTATVICGVPLTIVAIAWSMREPEQLEN